MTPGKSCYAALNLATKSRFSTDDIINRRTSLPELPHDHSMDYFGMLVTLALDYELEKARIRKETHDRVAMLGRAKFQRSCCLH